MLTKWQETQAKNGEEYYKKIVELFGIDILGKDGEIDRNKLAEIIFLDKVKKDELDKLTKEYVVPKIIEQTKETENSVIDVPLLFESGLDKTCDIVIGIIAKKETCIQRIMKRDNIDRKLAIARIESQHNESYFKQKCNYCIFNEENSDLNKQINEILNGQNLSNENVIHIYDENIEYLQFRRLLEYADKVQHAYTLKPLDFGHNGNMGKRKKEVMEEYTKICTKLELNVKNVYRPHQTHTDVIEKVENQLAGIYTEDFQNVDGLITNKEEKILSLSFADCTALYFYDPIKNVIGNIHSGWQGTYKEIGRKAVRKLEQEYDCNPKDLICLIGPFIRKCCFEVDEDVKEMFYEKFKNLGNIEEIITKVKNSKYCIDTGRINRLILIQEGLEEKNIIDSNICTKCKHNKLHSYREEKELSGRNTSIITLI